MEILEETRVKRKRYCNIDEHAFDEVTPESAYWVGFLMADGNINDNNNIALNTKDEEHLVKYKNFLGLDNKTQIYTDKFTYKKYYGVSFRSRKMTNILYKYGITPRKSHTIKITDERLLYDNNLWRGVIDGNGCISVHKCGTPYIQLVGSFNLMNQFLEYCNKICNGTKSSIRKTRTIYVVTIGGYNAIKILDLLYTNSLVYLERKYVHAMKVIKKYIETKDLKKGKKREKLRPEEIKKIIDLKNTGLGREEIAKKLNMTSAGVWYVLNRNLKR